MLNLYKKIYIYVPLLSDNFSWNSLYTVFFSWILIFDPFRLWPGQILSGVDVIQRCCIPYSPLSFCFCPSSCEDVPCWPPGTSSEPGRSGTSRSDPRGPLPYSTASVAVSNISKYYTYLLIKFEGKMCFVILLTKLLPGLNLKNMQNIILVIHNFRELIISTYNK